MDVYLESLQINPNHSFREHPIKSVHDKQKDKGLEWVPLAKALTTPG
jgi:hypothetical protein